MQYRDDSYFLNFLTFTHLLSMSLSSMASLILSTSRYSINILLESDWNSWYTLVIHQRRQWHPTPVLLPGKSHGWRSLVDCSPWGRYNSDTTEWPHFHFSLSCVGEGNGNPLQCSCLENPRDGGAWWASVYGVAQSQTRLKWLSSSSSSYSFSPLSVLIEHVI